MLFESLKNKILPLNDDVIVYPAHGAGSACGKSLSKETFDTLGHQKKTNYALDPKLTKEEFIEKVTTGLMPPPGYFPFNVGLNKSGYESFETVLARGMTGYDPEKFELVAELEEALILDTRHQNDFIKEHIPGSVFIGIDGDFAPWVGALIPRIDQKILIIAHQIGRAHV